jgi:hypothetical protein
MRVVNCQLSRELYETHDIAPSQLAVFKTQQLIATRAESHLTETATGVKRISDS